MTVFIYALKDPDTGETRYVGKADDLSLRFSQHLSSARKGKRNNRRVAWIRSVLNSGKAPLLEVLDEVPEIEWQSWEAAYIQFFLGQGCRLVNGTLGGDGMTNPTVETREKMSGSHRGRTPWNKGVKASGKRLEHMQKMWDRRRGKPSWTKGIPASKEQREKNRIAQTGKKDSSEVKERKRQAQLARWEKIRLDNSIQNCMVSV